MLTFGIVVLLDIVYFEVLFTSILTSYFLDQHKSWSSADIILNLFREPVTLERLKLWAALSSEWLQFTAQHAYEEINKLLAK